MAFTLRSADADAAAVNTLAEINLNVAHDDIYQGGIRRTQLDVARNPNGYYLAPGYGDGSRQPNDFTQLSQIDMMLMKEQNSIKALERPVDYKKENFARLMAIRGECKAKYNQVYNRALSHGIPSDAAHKLAYDSANTDFQTSFSILQSSMPNNIHDALKQGAFQYAGNAMAYDYLNRR